VTATIEPFDSEAGYRAAIDLTLASALREVRIFDRDLRGMALEERARIARLGEFLASGRDHRLRVAMHDTTLLENRQPRLLALMREHADKVEVRRTPEHLRHLADCWLLADQRSGTIRFHEDHARGKCILDTAGEIQPWWRRADDLWEECEPCTPWATTGL
jgi:hypothetical protein